MTKSKPVRANENLYILFIPGLHSFPSHLLSVPLLQVPFRNPLLEIIHRKNQINMFSPQNKDTMLRFCNSNLRQGKTIMRLK